MCLLIFEQDKSTEELLAKLPPFLKDLLDYSNRQRLASQINEAMLEATGYQSQH